MKFSEILMSFPGPRPVDVLCMILDVRSDSLFSLIEAKAEAHLVLNRVCRYTVLGERWASAILAVHRLPVPAQNLVLAVVRTQRRLFWRRMAIGELVRCEIKHEIGVA